MAQIVGLFAMGVIRYVRAIGPRRTLAQVDPDVGDGTRVFVIGRLSR
jgi:hypothetical protein